MCQCCNADPRIWLTHYINVIISHWVSNLDCLLNRFWGADQRKHQSCASLAFVWGIHQWPVDSSHKGPVTRKIFPFDDVIMHPSIYNHTEQQPDTWTLCIISDMDFGTNVICFSWQVPCRLRKYFLWIWRNKKNLSVLFQSQFDHFTIETYDCKCPLFSTALFVLLSWSLAPVHKGRGLGLPLQH